MVNSSLPKYPAPLIATGTEEIIQQVLAHNQELMQLLSTNSGKRCIKNINRPPNPYTGYIQGKPRHPIPTYFEKYCLTHGSGRHKGGNCNSKATGDKEKTTMENNMDGSNYVRTEWQCGTVPRVATINNTNISLKSTDSNLVPSILNSYKHELLRNATNIISLKYDTGATRNYNLYKDNIIKNNLQPIKTGPRVRLHD